MSVTTTDGGRAPSEHPPSKKPFRAGPKRLLQLNPTDLLPTEEEWSAARIISPLIDRVDKSTLFVACKLFADPLGRRRSLGALSFLAHLLRYSTVDQMSLFAGSEICDVAKIHIPNMLKMCRNKKINGWPWCYDTTTKYISLFVAVGVLITHENKPGIYYLPLGAYVLLPKRAEQSIEKLATRRSKVRESAAFQQATIHCTVHKAAKGLGTSLGELSLGLVLDEQAAQVAIQEMYNVFYQEGLTPSPAMSTALLQVFSKHVPSLLRPNPKDSHRKFFAMGNQAAVAAHISPANQPAQTATANLPTILRQSAQESTIPNQESTHDDSMVDSAFSDITLITLIPQVLPSDCITEKNTLPLSAESTKSGSFGENIVDSQPPMVVVPSPHPLLDGPLSSAQLLAWRFSGEDHLDRAAMLREDHTTDHLAGLLSERYNHNNQKMRHYRRLIQEDLRSLDIAIIDALLRSQFPDPHHRKAELGGGWITQKYKEHRTGATEPLQEVIAWANTTYTYDKMQTALARVADQQVVLNQPSKRPLPEDIIVDSESLPAFWTGGGASALFQQGIFYVDLAGDLLDCDEYERWRENEVKELRKSDQTDDWDLLRDTRAYLEQRLLPTLCSPEEEARLLESLPAPLKAWLNLLEAITDPDYEELRITIAPVSRWRVIEVRNKHSGDVQCFRHAEEVERFAQAREATLCSCEDEIEGKDAFAIAQRNA